ncbi:hypothetical protein Rs2_38546 [Raphanus sativus]|nr:hypothetical protein Rs2_38542 [Raphanus sativus]KAJ4881491.1 hypothetical protein Rs2_38546 [Raphanus sativus]
MLHDLCAFLGLMWEKLEPLQGKSSWKMKPIMALMGVTLLYFLPANFAEVSRGRQELGRPIFIDKEPYQAISNNPKFKRSSEISSLLQRQAEETTKCTYSFIIGSD